jgi:hypothetical protein
MSDKTTQQPFMWSLGFLSAEELQAIGAVAVETAFLEWSLESDIYIACEVDSHVGELIAAGMMLDKKIDLLRQAVVPFVKDDPALQKQLAQVFIDLKAAVVDRNTVIHGAWMSDKTIVSRDDDGTLRITVSGEKRAIRFPRGAKTPKVVKVTEVMALAKRIAECRDRLGRALVECTDWSALCKHREARENRRATK